MLDIVAYQEVLLGRGLLNVLLSGRVGDVNVDGSLFGRHYACELRVDVVLELFCGLRGSAQDLAKAVKLERPL